MLYGYDSVVAGVCMFEASQDEIGIWKDSKGVAISVSASDLERHAYCPLSWKLSKEGFDGKGDAITSGIKKHQKIHEKVENFHNSSIDSRREIAVWTWTLSIVVIFLIDSIAFIVLEDDYLGISGDGFGSEKIGDLDSGWYYLDMYDTNSNGWNGTDLIILDGNYNLVSGPYELISGSEERVTFRLSSDCVDCIVIVRGVSDESIEISWSLSTTDILPPKELGKFLVMLSVSVLFFSILMIALPWRNRLGWKEPELKPNEIISTFEQKLFKPVWQTVDFVGGWISGGRIEGFALLSSIVIMIHGVSLYGADNRQQAALILVFVAFFWLIISSSQLRKVLLSIAEREKLSAELGIDYSTKINYSDDSKESSILSDENIGLRGRPDQIVVIDGNFIPVEQKTGKIPTKPHLSHKIQLLAYIHLIESSTGSTPPYGVLRYGTDVAFPVEWNESSKELLFDNIREIQRLTVQGGAKRNHNQIGKCRNCSRKHACGDAL
tara:strand:+ start:4471 stop:5952 length:1482 start_codon:yes stop_codon:yes gene_type:complete